MNGWLTGPSQELSDVAVHSTGSSLNSILLNHILRLRKQQVGREAVVPISLDRKLAGLEYAILRTVYALLDGPFPLVAGQAIATR
jgi:hypothetical protein